MAGPAQQQDFELWAGNTRTLKIGPVKQADGTTNADLTGASAKWAMSKKNTDAAAKILVQKDSADSAQLQIVNEAGAWYLLVFMVEADTKDLKELDYYHEADVVDVTGALDTVTIGTITLHQSLVGELFP